MCRESRSKADAARAAMPVEDASGTAAVDGEEAVRSSSNGSTAEASLIFFCDEGSVDGKRGIRP